MRVCVVGNGPSAKGRGREIDACDFVVRIKAFWLHGAENTGEKTNALAYYGSWAGAWDRMSELRRSCEHWFTHSPRQIEALKDIGYEQMGFVCHCAELKPIRWLTNQLWDQMTDYVKRHPSTGFVTVGMAMEILDIDELVLYGFDSTTVDRPNYTDARLDWVIDHLPFLPPGRQLAHDTLAEKRAIAEIGQGTWLGKPCEVELVWPDMPDLGQEE